MLSTSDPSAGPTPVVITEQDIVFNCPKCEGELVVDQKGAGLEVPCPHCKTPLIVPETSPARLAPVVNEAHPVHNFNFSDRSPEQLAQREEELAHQLKENQSQDMEMRGHINRGTIELHRLQLKLAKLQERKVAIAAELDALRAASANLK